MKGLIVDILKHKGVDCSYYGISSKSENLTLIGEGIDPVFDANQERPAVKIVKRNLFGSDVPYVHAEPVNRPEGCSAMFGGTFIYSSDARFRKISPYPIPLHDRFEGRTDVNVHPDNRYSSDDRVKQVLSPLVKEMKFEIFTPDHQDKVTDEEVLGVIISKFTEYDGQAILSIARSAFEDANFRHVNRVLPEDVEEFEAMDDAMQESKN